uniref:Myb/SANT-like DNA-binding domain-containing protein n=1 Tax=Salvator merianae TaxID=96440 RepID=A0A8D0B936_SALMN
MESISWQHEEIMDRLGIWGEQKVQDQLWKSCQNIDQFALVAAEMKARGHSRSVEECRRKTKNMHQEYRKVINHNAHSSSNRIRCPYYKELHSILRGDASVASKRVTSSMAVVRGVPPCAAAPSTAITSPSSPDLFEGSFGTVHVKGCLGDESSTQAAIPSFSSTP